MAQNLLTVSTIVGHRWTARETYEGQYFRISANDKNATLDVQQDGDIVYIQVRGKHGE